MNYQEIKKRHKLTLKEISEETKINIFTLSKFFNGRREPSELHKRSLNIYFDRFI